MRELLFTVFTCLISTYAIGQKSTIKYIVPKDTVQSGEVYRKTIYVDLAEGDSLLDFRVVWNELDVKPEGRSSKIAFAAFHRGSAYKEAVIRQERLLQISLKTLKVDTVIATTSVYYTRPGPAYVRSLNSRFPYKYEVYPTKKPKLKNYQGDVKHFLRSTILKGQKGELAFTFVVNTKGLVEYPKIHHNTFAVKEGKILEALLLTHWTIGMKEDKYVNSLQGEIIEIP